jgi:hypothetical protein
MVQNFCSIHAKQEFRSANRYFTNELTLFCSVCKYLSDLAIDAGNQSDWKSARNSKFSHPGSNGLVILLENGSWRQDWIVNKI